VTALPSGIEATALSEALTTISLDDKFTLERGRVYMSGTQALIRMMMMQRVRDVAAGLNTGGFISGYRGSPLGGVDQTAWKAEKFLKAHHVQFQPGLNEEIAATSVWGTQQVNLYPEAKYDGVFAMWYGKGPGVDRCADVFKHGNMAGSSKHGGVLVIAGDDHGAKSSTLPHQSEHIFSACVIPTLNPSSVQEYLDYGIHGIAMSRYSGLWVGMKAVADTVESSATVDVDAQRVKTIIPTDFPQPEGGVNIRWPDPWLGQEKRMHDYKIYMAMEYARVNKLNEMIVDSPRPRFGIVTTGKSYQDTRQALEDLGIDDKLAAEIGLRVFKVGMSWPLEPEGIRQFAEGLDEILVIEEKRQIIEYQLKEQLYNWREDVRPRVIGKFDMKGEWVKPHGEWLLPAYYELNPAMIAKVIAARIEKFYVSDKIKARLAVIEAKDQALAKPGIELQRTPYFCSGCPHNTSTKVPEGSRAVAGIGCHFMSVWMDRQTETFTQMGGEGTPWIGQAPFTNEKHIFANLGDGTYFHSGALAIRASIAAKVNITYKILYNDAVAMTGGQPHDGMVSPKGIAEQVIAEGIARCVIVTDQREKYVGITLPHGVEVKHRDLLDAVQREYREIPGTTAIIYDQTCAAEKRRRRKRNTFPDPNERVVINDLVCEGCGDCSVQSNCVSVAPLETEYGRKRTIDQSSCNKDFSCVKGFCPSFVTVKGGQLRKPEKVGNVEFAPLPAAQIPTLSGAYNVLVTGIGGTGVVTIGQLIGMASHLEGKGVSVLDMAGLAQKNGAVTSHIRIAPTQSALTATRIATGEADVVLACDVLTGAGAEALSRLSVHRTSAVVNTAVVMPASFTRNPNLQFPLGGMEAEIKNTCGADSTHLVNATRIATALCGDSIAANVFVLGYAFQKGLIPLQEASLLRAIELNAAAVEMNKSAFVWGRRAAADLKAVQAIASPKMVVSGTMKLSESLDDMIARRVEFLTHYQNAAYAKRYSDVVANVRQTESAKTPGKTALAESVARYLFKLMAIKDEYEVARLYTDGTFEKQVASQFEGNYELNFHLAPPLLAKKDPVTGHLIKKRYGSFIMLGFKLLAKMKGLRGSALDVFGNTAERKMERGLLKDYLATIDVIVAKLAPFNHAQAVALAKLPEGIRGFGHVKERHVAETKVKEIGLRSAFDNATATLSVVSPTMKAAD
jgi:indolepyruvate ferredoxin oxidoreductase